MTNWTIGRTSGYFVRMHIGEQNDCYAKWEAYELISPDDELWFRHTDYGFTPEFDDAERYAHGHIKWDGCVDFAFDDLERNCLLHLCAESDAEDLANMLKKVYELAPTVMVEKWHDR